MHAEFVKHFYALISYKISLSLIQIVNLFSPFDMNVIINFAQSPFYFKSFAYCKLTNTAFFKTYFQTKISGSDNKLR